MKIELSIEQEMRLSILKRQIREIPRELLEDWFMAHTHQLYACRNALKSQIEGEQQKAFEQYQQIKDDYEKI